MTSCKGKDGSCSVRPVTKFFNPDVRWDRGRPGSFRFIATRHPDRQGRWDWARCHCDRFSGMLGVAATPGLVWLGCLLRLLGLESLEGLVGCLGGFGGHGWDVLRFPWNLVAVPLSPLWVRVAIFVVCAGLSWKRQEFCVNLCRGAWGRLTRPNTTK